MQSFSTLDSSRRIFRPKNQNTPLPDEHNERLCSSSFHVTHTHTHQDPILNGEVDIVIDFLSFAVKMSPLNNKNEAQTNKSSDLESYQHQDGNEEDPLVSFDRGHHSSSSASELFARCCRLHWKKNRNFLLTWTAVIALLVVFVRKVSHQAEEEVSTHTILAANALVRLNSNIQHLPPKKCTVTVLIARHCNDYGVYAKDDDESGDKHCSYVGYERTRYFASQFADINTTKEEQQHQRWPSPIALYALLPEQHKGINYRQIETLLPLAGKSNANINIVGKAEQVASSIFDQLQNTHRDPAKNATSSKHELHESETVKKHKNDTVEENPYCGQVIVIAWKHDNIPEVAAALGCGPDQGCPLEYPDDDYDLVWQLRFVHEPPAPKNEVPWLVHQDSPFLIDDSGHLLSQQQRKQLDAAYVIDGYNGPSKNGTGNPFRKHISQSRGWTVYGTVTNQNFDPLQASYQHSMHRVAKSE